MGSGHSEAWLRAVRLSKPFPQNTLSARLEVKVILSLNGHLLGCTQRLHTGEGENGNMSPAMWTVCDNAGTSHQWAQCPVAGCWGHTGDVTVTSVAPSPPTPRVTAVCWWPHHTSHLHVSHVTLAGVTTRQAMSCNVMSSADLSHDQRWHSRFVLRVMHVFF